MVNLPLVIMPIFWTEAQQHRPMVLKEDRISVFLKAWVRFDENNRLEKRKGNGRNKWRKSYSVFVGIINRRSAKVGIGGIDRFGMRVEVHSTFNALHI